MLPVLVLVLVLAGLLVLYIVIRNRPEEQVTNENIMVVEASNTDIDSITYTYDGQTIGFVKNSEGNWVVDGEEEFPLNTSKVQVMAGCLGLLTADLEVEANGNLADYGLEEPEITVVFTANGTTQTLAVGDQYPYGDERYVSSSLHDGKIYVVTSLIADDFDLTRNDLFNAIVLPTDEADSDTGMAYSYIVDYRRDNFADYGLGEGAEAITVSYEVSEDSEVEVTDGETGETTTETVTNTTEKAATYYIGTLTEDESCYYVNPEGSDYVIAVEADIIDSFRPVSEEISTEDTTEDTSKTE